ncbi:MAG: cell division protein FtsZ [Pseudomonadota bacterium]|nr:cell division protein FtsZ [Pseudomonadota bacterium]
MTINFTAPKKDVQLKPRITVFGVGGAGGNAVNNMINNRLDGVDFVVANTDAQAISQSNAERKVQLGVAITHGLGAGARPDMGRAAAEEAIDEITQHLCESHMVFIAAGMGGGTGTGAAPVIARLAREQGMLTVGVVTKPFQFEGNNRMKIAEAGVEEMQQFVDTLIVIPNQNLFRIANEKTTFADAFAMADDVLHSGVRGVTDLMVVPGLINLDFADIRSVMSEMGKAMMGTGEAEGDDRARLAAEAAISNPLLDDVSMRGARGVLINITGGQDMTLFEVDEAANRIGEEVDAEANIIFGSALDPALEGKLRVSVVATGIDVDVRTQPRSVLSVGDKKEVQPSLVLEETEEMRSPRLDLLDPDEKEFSSDVETPVAQKPLSVEPTDRNNETVKTADNFIPPEPVVNPNKLDIRVSPDPFREAELLNSTTDASNESKPSLFRRITKGAWPTRNTTSKTETKIENIKNEATSSGTAPALSKISSNEKGPYIPTIEGQADEGPILVAKTCQTEQMRPSADKTSDKRNPTSETNLKQQAAEKSTFIDREVSPSEKVSEQKNLIGITRENSTSSAETEEDLLDIPAFLRRQAN